MMRLSDIANRELAPLRGDQPGPPSELHRRLDAAKRTLADGDHQGSLGDVLHTNDLHALTDEIGSLVPVSCDGDSIGYLNPKNAFNLKRSCGSISGDYASAAALKSAAAELSRLWGDDMCVTGMDLARNAILLVILEDPALREQAVEQARAWLDGLSGRIAGSGLSLHP